MSAPQSPNAEQAPYDPPSALDDPNSLQDDPITRRVAKDYLSGSWLAGGNRLWWRWTGKRWAEAEPDTALKKIRDCLLDIWREEMDRAQLLRDDREAKAREAPTPAAQSEAIAKAAELYERRIKALTVLQRGDKATRVRQLVRGEILVDPTRFDADPDILNCQNGIVNLKTGVLSPHDPTAMCTKITGCDYVPGFRTDDWDATLTALDDDQLDYMQARLGQAITGHPPEDDVMPILRGGGANGKSTLFDGIRCAVGDYFVSPSMKAITGNSRDHSTELTDFKGARVAWLEELPEGDWLDVDQVKRLVGTSIITARRVGENNMTWRISHSMFMSTNHAVQVTQTDWGSQRRLALVVFRHSYSGPEADRPCDTGLRPRLKNGENGNDKAVLSWLVDGAMRWYVDGKRLPPAPDSVQADTAAWLKEANPAAVWIDENLILDPAGAVLAKDVYSAFTSWQQDSGARQISAKTFWLRAESHEWFRSHKVAKALVRTEKWNLTVSGHWGSPLPEVARGLTGVRWRTRFDGQEARAA